jgi:hypothetical protein
MSDTPLTDEAVNDTALEDKNQPHTDWVTAHSCRLIERRLNTANDVIFRLKNEIERTRFFLITPPSDGSNEGEWIMRLFRYSLEVDNQTDDATLPVTHNPLIKS